MRNGFISKPEKSGVISFGSYAKAKNSLIRPVKKATVSGGFLFYPQVKKNRGRFLSGGSHHERCLPLG